MLHEHRVAPLAIDLTRMHPRTVTSFYSNLVTRPTGRAVRMGVESQIAELPAARAVSLSILDFSQVRVVDYSCADEIVAKLLLRYATDDRPGDVYFLVRGVQEHHQEAIEAVLEHHRLVVCAEDGRAGRGCSAAARAAAELLGRGVTCRPRGRRRGCPRLRAAAEVAARTLGSLAARRVLVPLVGGSTSRVSPRWRRRWMAERAGRPASSTRAVHAGAEPGGSAAASRSRST
jgi:hypothetical protein